MGRRRYTIEIKPSAVRMLRRLPAPVRAKVVSVIDALADDPRPPGCKKPRWAGRPLPRPSRRSVPRRVRDPRGPLDRHGDQDWPPARGVSRTLVLRAPAPLPARRGPARSGILGNVRRRGWRAARGGIRARSRRLQTRRRSVGRPARASRSKATAFARWPASTHASSVGSQPSRSDSRSGRRSTRMRSWCVGTTSSPSDTRCSWSFSPGAKPVKTISTSCPARSPQA